MHNLAKKLRIVIKKLYYRKINKIYNQHKIAKKNNNAITHQSLETTKQHNEVIIKTCADKLGRKYCASTIKTFN